MHIFLKLTLFTCLSLLSSCGIFKGNEPDPEPLYKLSVQEIAMQVKWSQSVGITANDKYYGRMITAVKDNYLYVASLNGRIAKYNSNNGKIIWSQQLANAKISGGIAVTADKLFVGTLQGGIYTIDTKNGKVIWKDYINSSILNSPVASGKYVAVQTENDTIQVFETNTGKTIWSHNANPAKLGLRGTSKPAIIANNNLLAACFSDGKIQLFDLASGKTIWKFAVSLPNGKNELQRVVSVLATPLVSKDSIYAATYQGRITKFDINGNVLWSSKTSTYQNLAEGLDSIYLVDDTSIIKSFSKRDGNLIWQQKSLMYRKLTAPVAIKDYLAVADEFGYLHIISQINGELVGRLKLGGKITAPMTYDNKDLYVLSSNKLHSININFIKQLQPIKEDQQTTRITQVK